MYPKIETSPVSVITLVLRKIDLRQADYSTFLEVNHPCIDYLGIKLKQLLQGCSFSFPITNTNIDTTDAV